ncbi:MAG: regulatory protein RecX [Dehalococcoidia bacterium]|jgi:regulatory protein|nr:regulatory protein RecX [Dehalococcoidia bacterium]
MDEEKTLEKATSLTLRYLSYRPRSEHEVRSRLRRRYDEQVAESVIERVKALGLLDDAAFAQAWSRGRMSFRPRSAALIRRELLAKGVDRETVQATVETLDDDESAYKAGLRAATSLNDADYASFRRRLWGYLHRRGFDQSIVRRTASRLWEEHRSGG